jgi:hypothetical protein
MRFRIGPILRNAGPLGAQAFLIGIGILDDKRSQPLWMRRDDAKADRPAIVMKVEGIFVDLELLKKIVVLAKLSKVYPYDDGGGASL